MCSKAEEKSKVVCKVCGSELELVKKNHYVATDNLKTGAMVALAATEEQWYDAFDCPVCGCQHIAGERKRKVRNVIFRELQEDLVSDNIVEEDSFDALDEPREEVCDKNPDHQLPSCFGKELEDADKDCVWCEKLNSCLGVQECFGSKNPFKVVTNKCRKCSAAVRRKCFKVYNEVMKNKSNEREEPPKDVQEKEIAAAKERDATKAYPICIGDQALREEDNDDCQMCFCIDECTRRINEASEQRGERWEEPLELPYEL